MEKKLGMVAQACHKVQASLGKKQEAVSKITRAKKDQRCRDLVQAIEHLPTIQTPVLPQKRKVYAIVLNAKKKISVLHTF
jgi:hypothetical protein